MDNITTDKEYLERELIKVEYNISKDKLLCQSSGTLFVNMQKPTQIDIKQLLETRSNCIKLAKELGISVSYANKTKQRIENSKAEYFTDIAVAINSFELLVRRWVHIRDKRGIHLGCRDDIFLQETYNIQWSIEKLYNRDRAIGIMESVNHYINETYNKLLCMKNNNNLFDEQIIKIYL